MEKDIKELLIDCANFIQPYDDGGNQATPLMKRIDDALKQGKNLVLYSNKKWKHRPRPGDYYGIGGGGQINSKNGLTWHQTYLNDLDEYNKEQTV